MSLFKIIIFGLILAAAVYAFYRFKIKKESEKLEKNVKTLESELESEVIADSKENPQINAYL